MQRIIRSAVVLVLLVALSAFLAGPAFALYPKLSTKLTGPLIGGSTPQGDAKVDQSGLPSTPPTVEARVKNVNLPDGTVLAVQLTDCVASQVGTITLRRGEGQLRTTVPGCEVGRTSAIHVSNGANSSPNRSRG